MAAPQDGAPRVEIEDLTAMIDLVKEAGWRQVRLRLGDFELELSDGSNASPQPSTPSVVTADALVPANPTAATSPPPQAAAVGTVVRAQSIGIFWRSPQPGAPSFVEVGDTVAADTPLAIIEVMKMMTRIEPGTAGVITAIHVENGEVVEFDQPLFTIRVE